MSAAVPFDRAAARPAEIDRAFAVAHRLAESFHRQHRRCPGREILPGAMFLPGACWVTRGSGSWEIAERRPKNPAQEKIPGPQSMSPSGATTIPQEWYN